MLTSMRKEYKSCISNARMTLAESYLYLFLIKASITVHLTSHEHTWWFPKKSKEQHELTRNGL